jgi:hypothetical protein
VGAALTTRLTGQTVQAGGGRDGTEDVHVQRLRPDESVCRSEREKVHPVRLPIRERPPRQGQETERTERRGVESQAPGVAVAATLRSVWRPAQPGDASRRLQATARRHLAMLEVSREASRRAAQARKETAKAANHQNCQTRPTDLTAVSVSDSRPSWTPQLSENQRDIVAVGRSRRQQPHFSDGLTVRPFWADRARRSILYLFMLDPETRSCASTRGECLMPRVHPGRRPQKGGPTVKLSGRAARGRMAVGPEPSDSLICNCQRPSGTVRTRRIDGR